MKLRCRSGWKSNSGGDMLAVMPHSIVFDHMFQLPLPVVERLLRPVIVCLVLVALLRIFGKRRLRMPGAVGEQA
jgi:hypothetical protein